MLDVTSSVSIARFEPWTEREGGGQMRSGKRVATQTSLVAAARWSRSLSPRESSRVTLESHRCVDGSRLCSDGPPDDLRRPPVPWTVCGELVDD